MAGQIERIRVFAEVAEHKSFAEAARQLGITRSIATRYVGELEALLGVQLLVRTTRKVSLTVAGQIYLERTQPLLGELNRADELVRQQHETLQGKLRVSVPFSLGQRILPQILSRLMMTYPDLELDIELSDEFVDIVKDGFDMSLRISGPPSDVSTIWRKIAVVPRIFVGSPAYLRNYGEPQGPSELGRRMRLGYSHFASGHQFQVTSLIDGSVETVASEHNFICNNGDLIADLAAAGHGIIAIPKFMILNHLEEGSLVEILHDWQSPEIWMTAYYPPYEKLPAKVEAFTSFVEDYVKANPTLLT
ncbi:LysR family transcriptional regulator [Lentilitoribacter sp. Alg239-R112]|uniref:LysR family transcriptional regulator n=1 Tax=Lentilitoribacter sp. Alg239-R112 TaxID=2305987 RepID=UPI0013A6D753|nr:LysR family transcriptional regulator [Lentilitoribacter sp. Alg239-R112]